MTRSAFVLAALLCLPFPIHAQTQSKPAPVATASVSGRATLKGEPARNVLVTLQPYQNFGPMTPASWPRAKTDEAGRFRITGVAAGRYQMLSIAPGYTLVADDEMYGRSKILTVSEGENIENQDIEIHRGGVIAGRIIDARGAPVVDERVSLRRLDKNNRGQEIYSMGISYDMFNTDDRGEYRLYGLPEGKYTVSAGHSTRDGEVMFGGGGTFYPRTYYPNVTEEAQAKPIEVTEGSEATEIDITLAESQKTYDVYGRVVNADTGQPVAGVELSYGSVQENHIGAWGAGGDRSQTTGEFRLSGVLPGKYAVFVNPRGATEFYSEPTMCEIIDADVHGIEVRVKQGSSVSGSIVLEGASDPATLQKFMQLRFYANTYSRDRSSPLRAPTGSEIKLNPDGSFHLKGIQPGILSINLMPMPNGRGFSIARIEQNGAPPRENFEVGAGEQVTGIRVVVAYGNYSIRGEVKIIGGQLPAKMMLSANLLRPNQPRQPIPGSPVDSRGQFLIENLAAGEYELRVNGYFTDGGGQGDPQIFRALSRIKERVIVGAGSQQPITILIDLSQKEER